MNASSKVKGRSPWQGGDASPLNVVAVVSVITPVTFYLVCVTDGDGSLCTMRCAEQPAPLSHMATDPICHTNLSPLLSRVYNGNFNFARDNIDC